MVAYRLQHGEYQAATELLGIKIFKSDWVEKIAPYLSFETIGEKAGKD
jgi:DNA uptake protein ComE-like DNA-binding protein